MSTYLVIAWRSSIVTLTVTTQKLCSVLWTPALTQWALCESYMAVSGIRNNVLASKMCIGKNN